MGLDISVFKNVKKVNFTKDQLENDEQYDSSYFSAFVISDEWNDRIKNLESGSYYEGEHCDVDFSCGYSSYGSFRDDLAKMTGKGINWRKVTPRKDVPFYELLDFADNEGCFDWDVSEELYKDFAEWKEVADRNHNERFVYLYNKMMEVVNFGKDKGVVVFR